ncbi:hypothetical protein BU17DRAFT_101031 [Hysterangium stoloniferum]|nr:hypothetical protein BU17DRAFT_101031 [Hysterangium stoloniferum]
MGWCALWTAFQGTRSDPELNMRFLYVVQMGLIASRTPFVNGRLFTLFFNDEVHSSGAVRVAPRAPWFLEPTICFGGLEPLAAGLDVVTQRHIAKEDDIYIRLSRPKVDGSTDPGTHAHGKTEESSRIYRVLSGGSSRGFIALDMDEAVKTKTYLEVTDVSSIALFTLCLHTLSTADSDSKAYTPAEEVADELRKKTFQVLEPTDLVDEHDGSMDVIRSFDSDRDDYTACPQDVEHELLSAHMVWFIQNDV